LRENRLPSERFIQIYPAAVEVDKHVDLKRGVIINYRKAEELIKSAVSALPWVNHEGVSNTCLAPVDSGIFSIYSAASTINEASEARLKEVFKGISLAVIAGAPSVSNAAVLEWEHALSRYQAVTIDTLENAKAIVVVIPKDSPPAVLNEVYDRYKDCKRPWKIVNPDAKYKDRNVLVGIATRFGHTLKPITSIRDRDPNIWFMGIDMGHADGIGTTIAATLVDCQGRLVAWTQGPNTSSFSHRNAEVISELSMRKIARSLLKGWSGDFDWSNKRLVIHRDGNTLEDVDVMIDILNDELGGVRHIDWLDVNKQRAPFFFIDPKTVAGQFVIFEDIRNGTEMWVRTASGQSDKYARPLCLTPRTLVTDIETLGLEVFDLANVATQDSCMKTKLPVTTYFADGFSSTGEKRVKFWGYEQLKKDWA
jgi:hypothetical protein